MRALISVYDKTGLVPFARGLADLGFELVASGGTATALEDARLAVTRVEDVTGFPEMLGGRVKTLHPRIHAGILARGGEPGDLRALEEHGIERIDLVCVDLYPFEQVASRRGLDEPDVVEMIDIGGPSLLRAAAKNFVDVAVVSRPRDYDAVLAELRERKGSLSPETRRRLATTAFAVTAAYDSVDRAVVPGRGRPAGDARPGVRPRARPRLRREPAPAGRVLRRARAPHACPRARGAARRQAALVQQRQRPLGRAAPRPRARRPGMRDRQAREPVRGRDRGHDRAAYERALAADPVSAYGGVVVLDRAVTAALGEALRGQFVEVLFAPGFDEQAMEALAGKASVRILNDTERRGARRDRARLQARARRPPRPGSRLGSRPSARAWTSSAARSGRRDLARPRLRVPRREARDVERDRPRARRSDARASARAR